MGFTNFLVTNSAASLPNLDMRTRTYENTVLYTHCHHLVQFGGPESDHDRIGIAVYDFRVVCMAVSNTVFRLDLLRIKERSDKEFLYPRSKVLTAFVFSIICRPYAVTLDEMARQGSFPIVAPVKPYTEFALIYISMNRPQQLRSSQPGNLTFKASWRPSNTARLKGSVSFFKSAFARLRALIKSSNTVGRSPFRRDGFTNQSLNVFLDYAKWDGRYPAYRC
jgi:hypothetical protein